MILYAKGETQFNHLGLGVLSEATKAIVTEERNGAFHLEMEYPIDGTLFDEIVPDALIKVDAGHKSPNQLFFVSKITKPLRGAVKIYAQHVSRQAEKNQLATDVSGNGTATQAIQAWIDNLVDKTAPWVAYSDKNVISNYSWKVKDTDNAMRALGGQAGSLLQVYRGEYEFDNWTIRLWTNRGKRADTIIAYGRNLISFEQEEIILDTYTSVMPFIYREEGDQLLMLPEIVVDSEHVNAYPARKIFKLDLSEKESITTEAQLRAEAESYIERNNLGVPKVSIRLKHQDLSQVMGYEDAPQELIGLCDTVPIYFERLGISTEAKVVAVKWNVLLKRYEELTFGETSGTLAQAVSRDIMPRVERIRDEAMRYARLSADGKNTVYQGETEPTSGHEGDIWFKAEGTETSMYRYENGAWVRVIGTADEIDAGRLTTGTLDAAQVNVINIDANSITSGRISSNFLQIGADTLYIGDDTETTLGTRFDVLDGKITSTVSSAVSGLASESYVDSAINSINRANPNLVSNRSDRWEQGNIVDGSLVASAKHIRTQSYYPIRAGSVTMKVSPLYEVALVRYSDSYGYLDTTTFATEQTINIASNQYFKAVLKRAGTDDILPSAIDTAELKVENAAEATQWTPYFGDLTLDEQRDLFVLDITSTNGWTVDTNEWTTQLQAKLYLFNEDVTSRFLGSSITWFRQYPDSEKAIISSGQIFNVTPSMTDKSATYEVVFNLPANNYYIMTKTGDRILTKGGDLILARVSNDPGISVSASKVLVRDYRDRILSTEATLSIQANQIQQKVEQSSYNADKNVIENNITTLTTKVGSVEASVNGATHTFTQTGYEFRDTKGDVIFSLTKGMANEQNLMKHDDCENGYPLIIPIHIGASTASIEQVLVKWRNSPFRATAKSAASGGGTKTSASGGGTTSGASSASTTASGGSASVTSASGGGHTSGGGGGFVVTASDILKNVRYETGLSTGSTSGHSHTYSRLFTHGHDVALPSHTHQVYNHSHTVSIPAHSHSMPHTHSNPNHTHTIDLNHSHSLVFGVVEQAVSSNALTIWVDGVQRGSVNATQGELDVTPYLQTTGWHTVELRTTTLKRIDANIFVKSYIRR